MKRTVDTHEIDCLMRRALGKVTNQWLPRQNLMRTDCPSEGGLPAVP